MVFHKVVEADDRPVLDGSMTTADLVFVLDNLRFRRSNLQTIAIDKHVRDFLLCAVRDRQGKRLAP
jgi:hypothetical protein